MNLNLFKNDEYFEAMLRAQQEMTALFLEQDAPEEEIPEAVIQEMQAFLSEAFDSSLVSMLPVQKNVHSGVYVIPLSREFLEESVMAEMTPFMNLLDYGLQFMNFSGYFNPGSFQNLIMDQENQIASFNASVSLGNVEIDGRKTDAILNNIGFIVTGHERAIFVNLIYLSVDNIAVYESLQDFLESLRFTG
ncbi:hypothetical protein N836_18720 [Leptolyngbya sp. Heron Island J]|nr:hypothetical protein N836_18720 [Leptolyngbya sp. Heron Island J]